MSQSPHIALLEEMKKIHGNSFGTSPDPVDKAEVHEEVLSEIFTSHSRGSRNKRGEPRRPAQLRGGVPSPRGGMPGQDQPPRMAGGKKKSKGGAKKKLARAAQAVKAIEADPAQGDSEREANIQNVFDQLRKEMDAGDQEHQRDRAMSQDFKNPSDKKKHLRFVDKLRGEDPGSEVEAPKNDLSKLQSKYGHGKPAEKPEKRVARAGGGAGGGKGSSDEHNPFSHSPNLGPSGVKFVQPRHHDETHQWSCHCGNIYTQGCKCVGIGADNKGKIKHVKIKKGYRDRYNKEYHAWRRGKEGAVTQGLAAKGRAAGKR